MCAGTQNAKREAALGTQEASLGANTNTTWSGRHLLSVGGGAELHEKQVMCHFNAEQAGLWGLLSH